MAIKGHTLVDHKYEGMSEILRRMAQQIMDGPDI